MNIVLGVLVALCCVATAAGFIREAVSKLRKRRSYTAELNHDMEQMFGSPRAGVAAPCAAGVARSAKSRSGLLRRLRSALGGIRR